MTSDHAAIDGIFELATLAPSLAARGIDRTVLVQGADLGSDTDFLFELGDWGVDDLIDPVKVAIDNFGPDRLMCGSDWPVALLNGEYDRVWGTLVEVLELVAPDSVPRILGQTARDLYELDDPVRSAIGAG
jgi:predicted TIM-barrel fold metal-dependent hydrolase